MLFSKSILYFLQLQCRKCARDKQIWSKNRKPTLSSLTARLSLIQNKEGIFIVRDEETLCNSNADINVYEKKRRICSIKLSNKGEKARHLGPGMFSFLHLTHLFAGSVRAEQFREELFCNHSWASGTTEDLRVGAVMGCVCVSMYVHVWICACVCTAAFALR